VSVSAAGAARPSFASSSASFQFTWQENVGAPLPDLVEALILGTSAPPGFVPERINVQSWGTGTLRADTTVGTPGQQALVSTLQVADLTNSALPGTLPDGFWQEPINIIPVTSVSTHVGYLNGTLFVSDTSDGNDSVRITPAAGGAALSRNYANSMLADDYHEGVARLLETGPRAWTGKDPRARET
jgi:hypothetical protein